MLRPERNNDTALLTTLVARMALPVGLLFFVLFGHFFATPAFAGVGLAEALDWSEPRPVPDYRADTLTPVLVADEAGRVHAFSTLSYGESQAIAHSYWSVEQGWSSPVDILLPPLVGDIDVEDVFIDDEGMLHVVFFSGTDTLANIYYSRASALEANRAQAWSDPIVVGEGALSPSEASIVGDDGGNLFVVYSGRVVGNGIYAVYSDDYGRTWSNPSDLPAYLTYDDTHKAHSLSIARNPSGFIHSTWSVVDFTGNGLAVYYARFDEATKEWSLPQLIDRGNGMGANTPSIVGYEEKFILVYHNGSPTTRWMSVSADNGESWPEPGSLFSHVGSNGPAAFVKDDNGTLHMFFGNRVGNPAIHGMWHVTWVDDGWTEPRPIVSGPRVIDDPGGDGFDPSFANAIVVRGNLILVTWRTDPGAGQNGVWYAYAHLEGATEELVTEANPTRAPTLTPSPTLEPTPTLSPSLVAQDVTTSFSTESDGGAPAPNPSRPILFGTLTALLLAIVTIVWQGLKSRHPG